MKKIYSNKNFTITLSILMFTLIALLFVVGWYILSGQRTTNKTITVSSFDECVAQGNPIMESYPEQCMHDGVNYVNESQNTDNGWNTTVNSGQGAFEITFPDGMGEVIKPLDSDAFYVMGMDQPSFSKGEAVSVRETDGFGTDSASLLSIVLLDQKVAGPRGTQEPFTLVNRKENSVEGKKYVYTYPSDETEGIGYQRYAGDRNYTYIFPLKGEDQLVISYAVYGSDPHNNMATIEEIINTIYIRDSALLQ